MNNLRFMSPMKVATATAAWTPLSKANLVAWWRADSKTLSGSDVATAVDLSGNSETVTFANTRRPVFVSSALNGQDGWQGIASRAVNGAGTATDLFASGSEFSMVIVFKAARESVGDFNQLLNLKAGAANFALYTVNTIPTYNDINFGLSGGLQVGIASYTYTGANYLTLDYNGSGVTSTANWRAWRNGISQTLATSATSGSAGNTVIGAQSSGQSINGSGFYYDIFVYKGSGSLFTAGDLTGISQYISNRYAL